MSEKNFSKISFYIVAHADDWQLFMQPNVYKSLVSPDTKVVFIITTAGDAGADKTYWLSREEGCKSSVRFCTTPLEETEESIGTKELNGHTINFWTTDKVTSYFLRLPDGNIDGNGFYEADFHSLKKFKAGEIDKIVARDNSTIYSSWQDFCKTLHSIIESERISFDNVCINYLNPDCSMNPNDHSDHITTGQAVQAIDLAGVQNKLYVGYSIAESHEYLNANFLFWKAGMFAAYEKAVYDASGYSTLKEDVQLYVKWCLSSASFITIDS